MPSIVYRCLVALSLLALGGSGLAATTYRWVDAQGVVHYSDTPHPGAQEIEGGGRPALPRPAAPPPPRRTAAGRARQCLSILRDHAAGARNLAVRSRLGRCQCPSESCAASGRSTRRV